MGIWTPHTVPCTFNGFLCYVAAGSGPKEYRVATHGGVNRDGEYVQPLGARSRTFPVTFIFKGQYFEAHKPFLSLLDTAAMSPTPAVLMHPVWGQLEVYPEGQVNPQFDAETLEMRVEVTFRRHALKPESLTPLGAWTLFTFPTASAPRPASLLPPTIPTVADLSGYLANLAMMTAWNSAWLSAALTLLRLIGQFPSMLDRSAYALADSLTAIIENYWSPFSTERPDDDQVRSRYAAADEISANMRRDLRLREAVYQGILDGSTQYSAGIYADGRPRPGIASPPARQHSALLLCAQWETVVAGVTANQLTAVIQERLASQEIDFASADGAVLFLRDRIAKAMRLQAAANPLFSGATCNALSQSADSLSRLAAGSKTQRPPTREIAVASDCRPLELIALEVLGDDARAPEIEKLNPQIHGSFNRLARGTLLRVPAA